MGARAPALGTAAPDDGRRRHWRGRSGTGSRCSRRSGRLALVDEPRIGKNGEAFRVSVDRVEGIQAAWGRADDIAEVGLRSCRGLHESGVEIQRGVLGLLFESAR